MSTAQINYLNIGLMLVSLAAAIYLPFEVFLFSYAVLGPLHYLTEISWLHDRNYFTARKFDWTVLVLLTLLVTAGSTAVLGAYAYPPLKSVATDLIFVAFGFALVAVITDHWGKRGLAMIGILILAHQLHGAEWQKLVFFVFVPTIIHVFIFTGAFILFGALKHKHWSGFLSTLVFCLCAIACILVRRDTSAYHISEYVRMSYLPFIPMNLAINDLFGLQPLTPRTFFGSSTNVAIMQFIAWAYTYHYLNWFSKTSIIGWHKVPVARMSVVTVIWLASLTLYGLNYQLGVKWLFLLSFAHVLLEFPLNHRSFIGIGQELFRWMQPEPALVASKTTAQVERKKRIQRRKRLRRQGTVGNDPH